MVKKTGRKIIGWVRTGELSEPFSVRQVKQKGISFAGTFLPKHRVGNPDHNTELFVRVGEALYRLNAANPLVVELLSA